MALFIGYVIHSCRIHIKLCVFPIVHIIYRLYTETKCRCPFMNIENGPWNNLMWSAILSHWLGTSGHTSIEIETIDEMRCVCISKWNVREWFHRFKLHDSSGWSDGHLVFCFLVFFFFFGFYCFNYEWRISTIAENITQNEKQHERRINSSRKWCVFYIVVFICVDTTSTSNGIFYWHFRSDILLLIN